MINAEPVVRRYPLLTMALDFAAWLPVIFLFFSETLSLEDALRLEAIYYVAHIR